MLPASNTIVGVDLAPPGAHTRPAPEDQVVADDSIPGT
jgi:hypothetical protein